MRALYLIHEVNVLDSIKIKLQYWPPKLALTRLAGWGADKRAGWLTQLVIKAFAASTAWTCRKRKMDRRLTPPTTSSCVPLRDGARPIIADANWLALPADGAISQLGPIRDDQIFGPKAITTAWKRCWPATTCWLNRFPQRPVRHDLSGAARLPNRAHMPCAGVLREMIYVPGDLFSVNPLTAANVPNLFARNERVICVFDTDIGPMVQILVGATIVGSIETVWAGTGIATAARRHHQTLDHHPAAGEEGAIALEKGAEMGRFKLGPTVINLFTAGSVQLAPQLQNGTVTRMGEAFAEIPAAAETPQTPL
ncbi:archaetidylserine decarboxylase [Serratia ureilytica]